MKSEKFEDYLTSLYPPKTVISYIYTINKFKSEHPLGDDYNYQDIIDYLFSLKKAGLSLAYRTKILSALKKYFDFLRDSSYRSDHPCKRVLLNDQRLKGVHFDDLFTPDELNCLMQRTERYSILELKNKVLISLLIYQGLMSEEITRLTLDDVDLDAGIISIKSSQKLSSRKLELHRTQIMLFSTYLNELRPKLLKSESSDFLINKLGNADRVDNIHALIHSMKLIFPTKTLNPQQIRISVIANWLNVQKIPLSDVQLLAGHKWPSTTEKYLRSDLAKQKELINRFHPLERMGIQKMD